MSERVQISIESAVATVRLSRPEKRNALDAAMFESLIRTGKRIRAEKSIRAVVLHGEGKAFCAGLDFASFMGSPQLMQKLLEREEESPANMAQRAAWIWQEVNVPVIAALHGAAFGGGLQIALAADLRYVRPDAELSVMEIKWGLIPDMSLTQTLPRLVPLDVAKELTFTGRVVSGEEAVALGLATRVEADPLAAARRSAHDIAARSPDAIRAAKQLLNAAYVGSTEHGLLLEEEIQRRVIGKPNQLEAVMAGLQKRAPVFRDA
jgi:enoyl-CoA hydratase/carnithine racemase